MHGQEWGMNSSTMGRGLFTQRWRVMNAGRWQRKVLWRRRRWERLRWSDDRVFSGKTLTYQPFWALLRGSGVSVLTEENHEYNVLNYISRHAHTHAHTQGASILTWEDLILSDRVTVVRSAAVISQSRTVYCHLTSAWQEYDKQNSCPPRGQIFPGLT